MNNTLFDYLLSCLASLSLHVLYGAGAYALIKVMYPIVCGQTPDGDLRTQRVRNRFLVTVALWFAVSLYHGASLLS